MSRIDRSGHAGTADPSLIELAISRYDHECGVRLQHLPGCRRHSLARGFCVRGMGPILLHPRQASRPRLVRRFPANLPAFESHEVIFAADKATFRRRDGDIETVLEVIVSPEQTVEIRRITLINHGSQPRELELTSYAEIVLAPHGADLAHPAFGKLFLETEWVAGPGACSAGAGRDRSRNSPFGPCTFRPRTLRRRA